MDQLRHYYIKALGIVEYVPRDYIDAVPRSETCDPMPEGPQEVVSDNLSKGELPTAERSPTSGFVEPVDIVVRDSVGDVATVAIEFKLVLWQPSDGLLVCAMASEALPSATENELLCQIVQSLEPLHSGVPQFELIQWPPFPGAEGDCEAATDFVSTLLDARLKNGNISRLLIFGEDTAEWMLSERFYIEGAINQTVTVDKVHAIVVPSFDEIFSQSLLKRDIWRAIKQWSPLARFDSSRSQHTSE